jgi:hypothetical protein
MLLDWISLMIMEASRSYGFVPELSITICTFITENIGVSKQPCLTTYRATYRRCCCPLLVQSATDPFGAQPLRPTRIHLSSAAMPMTSETVHSGLIKRTFLETPFFKMPFHDFIDLF